MNLEELSRQKKRSAYMWLSLNDFLRMLFILRDSVKNECISRKTQSYKLISKQLFMHGIYCNEQIRQEWFRHFIRHELMKKNYCVPRGFDLC